MAITHSAVVVTADDGTSEVGSDEWNDDHVIADGTITAAKLDATVFVDASLVIAMEVFA